MYREELRPPNSQEFPKELSRLRFSLLDIGFIVKHRHGDSVTLVLELTS